MSYEKTTLQEARCPECGNEENNTRIERESTNVQPVPINKQARCSECDHTNDTFAFYYAYTWERMTEDERRKARERRARYEAEMAEYQHSAHYISNQREP